jgi:nucleoside-diphosphate-sugar epimerase
VTRWQGTSVLLTGAAGFIGANLARRLIELGAKVHAMVRPPTSLWRLEDVATGLQIQRVDMTDRASLEDAVRTAAPDVLFHLAATGAARHDGDLEQLFRTNVLGTVNLLAASEPLSYSRFVHVGGSSEYGPRKAPLRESDCPNPVTPYGASKAASTIACQQFARAHRRPIVILRPFSVYGPWEAPSRLIPTATLAAFEGAELPLTPPGYRRDFVYVGDVVDACLLAATADVPAGDVVNVGTGREWTNEEVVRAIERVSGRPIHTSVGQYRPRLSDTEHWVADTSKAERVLGWKAGRTLNAGLEESVSWWSAHWTRHQVLD